MLENFDLDSGEHKLVKYKSASNKHEMLHDLECRGLMSFYDYQGTYSVTNLGLALLKRF